MLAGLPADDLLGTLPQACGWNWHAGDQALLAARFAGRSHFGTRMPEGDYRAAVLFLPKSRELTDYLLQALASRLAGKTLYPVSYTHLQAGGVIEKLLHLGRLPFDDLLEQVLANQPLTAV